MSKLASALVGTLALLALAACQEKQLVVPNLNNPDQTRALASPTDVENLIGAQFRVIHNYTDGAVLYINSQLQCLGMENASGLGNAEMGKYCGIPRVPVDNTRGNGSYAEQFYPYSNLYRSARSAAMGLNAMDAPGFTFLPPNAAQIARDKAFGYFELGVALGDIALVYDSGAVVSPNDDMSAAAGPLVDPYTLMNAALGYLDSAIAYATAGANAFPTPDNWINGDALGSDDFIALVHSWKARLRAGVARTPAERAAVDWAQVIADAQAGITSDFTIEMTTGSPEWRYRPDQMDLFSAWHQMWQFMVGMADVSTVYDQYLKNRNNVAPFLVQTPDKRFPAGATRAAQNTASGCVSQTACLQPTSTAPYPYLRNRLTGADTYVDGFMYSQYDFYRFQWFFNATRNGPIPTLTKAELNGLIAEGKLRSGSTHDAAGAIALINETRTAAGLPAVAGDSGTTVPGGDPGCVPRKPDATAQVSVCGTVWEAMKWEKRMETAYTHWGAWWIDGRGWGDLPKGSVLEYPTPYEELDTRSMPIYSLTRLAPDGGTYNIQGQ